MTFQIITDERDTTLNLDPTVFVLDDDHGNGIEVWTAHGFNCYRWFVTRDEVHELLYATPAFFGEARPTRSGIPVLFPYPNRIRSGHFSWAGKEINQPLNDPAAKNSIHGFACRSPWRIVDSGSDNDSAWVTGEFWGSRDAPESLTLWPTDYRIRLTHRLKKNRLRLEAVVDNPDQIDMPFGLGYHPYFTANLLGQEETTVSVPAASYWQLEENLPTGKKLSVDEQRDLRKPIAVAAANLDDVLTDLDSSADTTAEGLVHRGTLGCPIGLLKMYSSPGFSEMVVFTPPHRQAICLEPYTCVTDAINLQQANIEAGLLVLKPGESWSGVVELHLIENVWEDG